MWSALRSPSTWRCLEELLKDWTTGSVDQVGLHTPEWRWCRRKVLTKNSTGTNLSLTQWWITAEKAELSHRNSCLLQQFLQLPNLISFTIPQTETFHILKLESAKLWAPESKVSPEADWNCVYSIKMKGFECAKEMVKLSENKKIKVSTVSNFLMDKSSNTRRIT